MIKLFIDSDVILDVLIEREEYLHAAELMTCLVEKKYEGYTTPVVIANIHYIMSKYASFKKSIQNIKRLRSFLSILTIDEEIIDSALHSEFKDFEDAIQYAASKQNGIDFIITRNKGDYKTSDITVLDAREFLELNIER
jgi:predicted nucleic acid-binding protein